MLAPQKKSYDKRRQCIKKQRHHFANKGPYSQSCGFSKSHVWMWELEHKDCWVPKNWCLQTVVLEKIPESPLNRKEIKPVNPKGNQPWIFFGRSDAEAEIPVLWPPDGKSQLLRKDLMLGKTEGRRRRKMRWLEGITDPMDMSLSKFKRWWMTGKPCCSPWGCKESDMTERLNNNIFFSKSYNGGFKNLPNRSCYYCKYFEGKYLDPMAMSSEQVFGRLLIILISLTQSVQSFSSVQLFATPRNAAHQASLSITNSQSPFKPMSIESVMPSNHLILSSPSPPALNLSQHQGLFKWVSSSHQVAKVLEFQL